VSEEISDSIVCEKNGAQSLSDRGCFRERGMGSPLSAGLVRSSAGEDAGTLCSVRTLVKLAGIKRETRSLR
jgi:hypothetical protein